MCNMATLPRLSRTISLIALLTCLGCQVTKVVLVPSGDPVMLAKPVKGIPDPAKYSVGDVPGLSFEPKWDGFRCLVFKDGDEVELASRRFAREAVIALSLYLKPRETVCRRLSCGCWGTVLIDLLSAL